MMILAESLNVEIDRSIYFITIAVVDNILNDFDLLNDMTGSCRFDTWRKIVELLENIMKINRVFLSDFHRFDLFQTSFFGDFVFAFISIVNHMPHIGNVTDISHLITQMFEVSESYVKRN